MPTTAARARKLLLSLGLGLMSGVGGLQGCAAPAPKPPQDVQTDSDQTDADRRARVRMELASAYFSRGQSTTALDEVKLALQAKPDLADAYNLRGLIYASLNEPALAEDSFRHALRLSPSDADTMHNFGWFLCQQRRYDDANTQFNAALGVPNYRGLNRTLLNQGVCQARNNQWGEAEKTLLRSYELDPANPTTAINLAEVLYRRGDFERARFYVRRVNAIDELVSAQTLWLAARIENRLGQPTQAQVFGSQLRNRFPQSAEAGRFEKGQFDE
jgi:type IV pilus assembly protein PilF